jgi:hypothetical protein
VSPRAQEYVDRVEVHRVDEKLREWWMSLESDRLAEFKPLWEALTFEEQKQVRDAYVSGRAHPQLLQFLFEPICPRTR